MQKIKIDENVPLLKFLIWSNPDATEVDVETAKTLYFAGMDWRYNVVPTDFEKELIWELLNVRF